MELEIGRGKAARLIVNSGALSSPFVLLDIGARGGVHHRWRALGGKIEVYGFDAGTQVKPTRPGEHYFQLAIGERDCETGIDISRNQYETRISETGSRVPMARLDTLWTNGTIPLADFIKLDCEGYEPQVLCGAGQYLGASNLLGADIETNFNVSPTLTETHFAAVARPLLAHRLLVSDIAVDRAPRTALPRPGTCNALLCRDLQMERDQADAFGYRPAELKPSPDTILKTIIILDLYCMNAAALELVAAFRDDLAPRIDTDRLTRALRSPSRRPPRFLPSLGLGLWRRLGW